MTTWSFLACFGLIFCLFATLFFVLLEFRMHVCEKGNLNEIFDIKQISIL